MMKPIPIKGKINAALRKATKIKEHILGGGFDLSNPEAVQIEPTIRCNFNCLMCDSGIKNRNEKKDMNFEDFKQIIEQFTCLKEINMTGFGEPLLNKDIFKMISYAKSKKIRVYFATNAMLIDKKCAENILACGLDYLIFSVDSGIPDVFEGIRKGANFKKILENIKDFMAMRQQFRSNIEVEIYSVLTFPHLKELKKLVDLAEKLKIKKLNVRAIFDHTGKSKEYPREALYYPSNVKDSENHLQEAKKYAEERDIELVHSPLRPIEYQCRMPSTRPYITVEGNVTPCCLQGVDPRNINFGNILEEGFKKIWNNKKYRDFRKELLSPKPPSICISCPRLKGMA
ncbi:MAG: radical SAM protein [Candidatus Aminicenantes bacterium]|nr:radical SAM protein [Candidatus Aminicenantes bacterium]